MNQQHKFSVGQQVQYSSSDAGRFRASGTYEITGLLPLEGLYLQYRVRNSLEKFDRVASEWQLDVISMSQPRDRRPVFSVGMNKHAVKEKAV